MAEYFGEYGGIVKREIKNAGGMKYIVGAVLKPEVVTKWPLANRMALHQEGKVDWYGPPVEAEQIARESGKAAPVRGNVGRATKTPAKAKEVPARANRRTR